MLQSHEAHAGVLAIGDLRVAHAYGRMITASRASLTSHEAHADVLGDLAHAVDDGRLRGAGDGRGEGSLAQIFPSECFLAKY